MKIIIFKAYSQSAEWQNALTTETRVFDGFDEAVEYVKEEVKRYKFNCNVDDFEKQLKESNKAKYSCFSYSDSLVFEAIKTN